MESDILAYLRPDGAKGIRNHLVVVYLVECSKHVAAEIARRYRSRGVHLIGFSGCYPNEYSNRMLQRLCTHSNVWGALLVSLGCEGFDRFSLSKAIASSGRSVKVIGVQDTGGTMKTIELGCAWIEDALERMKDNPRENMAFEELVVGTICGGSDASSGITANPGIGRCFDRIVESGGCAIFEETGELIGCEEIMAARAAHSELKQELLACLDKAARFYEKLV